MAVKIPAGLALRVPTDFLGDKDEPEKVQSPGVTSSDDTIAVGELVEAKDETRRAAGFLDLLVHRFGIGKATLTVTADADISDEGVSPISNTYDVQCDPVQATKIRFGDPTTEPEAGLKPTEVTELAALQGVDATPGTPAEKI